MPADRQNFPSWSTSFSLAAPAWWRLEGTSKVYLQISKSGMRPLRPISLREASKQRLGALTTEPGGLTAIGIGAGVRKEATTPSKPLTVSGWEGPGKLGPKSKVGGRRVSPESGRALRSGFRE